MAHRTTWGSGARLALCYTLRCPAVHRRSTAFSLVSGSPILKVSSSLRHLTVVLQLIFQLSQSLQDGLSFLSLLFALADYDGSMKVVDSSGL